MSCSPAAVRARHAVAVLLLASAAPALAAKNGQEPIEPQTVEGAKVYLPQEFARFAPRTALDMLRQVPGFIIQGASQERGLGQASGNVLINGQRISGKSNDAVTELGRIPAGGVVRIEIVDGATLNIAGLTGQVANVIVKSAGIQGQWQWRGEARARNTEPLFTNGSISIGGEAGPLAYTIGLRNDAYRSGHAGPAEIFDAAGRLAERRDEQALFSGDRPKLSGSLRYEGGGAVANLNASYERHWVSQRETSARFAPGLPDRLRTVRTEREDYGYEIGGDVGFGLGPGSLKLIGLRQFRHEPSDSVAITAFADGSPATGSRYVRTGDWTETVGRAEYRWRGGANDWQLSGEGAFNVLDNVAELFALRPDGRFAPVPLPGGTARVAEERYEAALTWGRPLSASLAVQASAGAERSTLIQSGPLGLERSFLRPKGFASLAWKAAPGLDVNARIERRVGQLNFYDFLASVNLGRDIGDAANPALVPPQSWDAQIELSRNWARWGSSTVRVYSRLIADIVDQIPIGEAGEASGNVESAQVAGIEGRGTLQLAPLGWAGAKLDARLQFQTSRLDDPLTGDPRRIGGDLIRLVDLNLRHDVPGTDWAWGAVANHVRRSATVRLGEISRNYEMSPFIAGLFVEHKDVLGMTVRASINNPIGANDYVDRIVWEGRRGGPIAFTEARNRSVGPIFALRLSGSI